MTNRGLRFAGSLRLDVREPDNLAPFLCFGGDELTEVGRRADLYQAAELGEPCLELGIRERRVDLPVELVNDVGRRVLWRANALITTCLVARHEFAHSRNVGQYLQARCSRDA